VLLLAAFWLLNPATRRTLALGHPEEALTAALAILGVLAAMRGEAAAAGILIGVAIATKQWALLAIPVAAIAVPPGSRARLAAAALAAAAVLYLPMALGDPGRFADAVRDVAADSAQATPTNIWWPVTRGDSFHPPEALTSLIHPAILLLAAGLAALAWRRRGRAADALGVLVLVLLLRCVLDLYTFSYHHAPFLMAAAVWGTFGTRGAAIAVAGSAGIALTSWASPRVENDVLSAIYLAWGLPLAAWVFAAAFRPAADRDAGRTASSNPDRTYRAGPSTRL
jgi:hypothetical protein